MNDQEVIASRDKKTIEEAFEAIDAAMGPNKSIDASFRIENSTIVTGYVGRDASTNVKGGEEKQAAK